MHKLSNSNVFANLSSRGFMCACGTMLPVYLVAMATRSYPQNNSL